MKFSCIKSDFLKALQLVERAVSVNNTMPVISNILMKVEDKSVTLYANDLELGIKAEVDAVIDSPGTVLVPAKTFVSIVAKLGNDKIYIEADDSFLVRIECGQSKFNIHGLASDNFPAIHQLTDGKVFDFNAENIKLLIKNVIFSVSNDESKHILNGVLFSLEEKSIKLVATDGYRLAKIEEKFDVNEDSKVVIPTKVLQELVYIVQQLNIKNIKVTIRDDQVSFESEKIYLVSKLIQGQYPDYNKVIPKESKVEATIAKRDFLQVCERVSIIASKNANTVQFEVSGEKMIVSAQTPDVGNALEILDVKTNIPTEVKVAFNVRLMIDVLKIIEGEQVVLKLSSALEPGVISSVDDEDYVYIVMPIRTVET